MDQLTSCADDRRKFAVEFYWDMLNSAESLDDNLLCVAVWVCSFFHTRTVDQSIIISLSARYSNQHRYCNTNTEFNLIIDV